MEQTDTKIQRMDKGAFELYYRGLIGEIVLRLENFCKEHNFAIPCLSVNLQSALREQFARMTIRTLILEMRVSKQCGELDGRTDQELYQSFVRKCVLNEKWLEQFYKNYPLLYKYVFGVISETAHNLCEVIVRFYQDREEIACIDANNEDWFRGNVAVIDGGNSDAHCGGKRVYILVSDNGKRIVYKPRSMTVDCCYAKLLRRIAKEIGNEYWWGWFVDKGEYGWCEWISALSCVSKEQLERYYERNGILLAVSYFLGSTDIHYENLIAHGEHPVVIDLEMGINRRGNKKETRESMAEKMCRDSVLRTGLLPMYAWNECGEGINVGAINAFGNQLVPIELPVVIDSQSVKMRIEYQRPQMKEGKNLATLNGQFIEPSVFLDEIEKGFELAYRYVVENKTAIKEAIAEMEPVTVRHLVKNTQEYMMIMGSSYHPSCINDENRRKDILGKIKMCRDNEKDSWIAKQEIEELIRGDIPYFWYQLGSVDLYSGTGEIYHNYFEEPAIVEIYGRINAMNEENLYQQKRLIRASLTIGHQGKAVDIECEKSDKSMEDLEQMGVAVAKNIADIMLEDAIWDGNKVGWISMMFAGYRERGCLIRAMGPYFYDGIAGVALFFAALYSKVKDENYRIIKECLINQLFKHTDTFVKDKRKEQRNSGGFTGEASIAYVYQLLFKLEKRNEFLKYMEKQCEGVNNVCEKDKTYDVLGGNAGAVLVFLNAFDLTREEKYLQMAIKAGEYLVKGATSNRRGLCWINPGAGVALTGFAHGASGIMLALAKLGKYSEDLRFSEAAYQAYCFEQSFYNPKIKNWTDRRFSENQQGAISQEAAWCHGWGGILLARKEAENYIDWEMSSELKRISKNLKINYAKRGEGLKRYNLCHGKMGQIAIKNFLQQTNHAENQYQKVIVELFQKKERFIEILGQQERENRGFMGGICGIGYACLGGSRKVENILTISLQQEEYK